MSKLNPESKTGFPWSFFVGKKKKNWTILSDTNY